MKALEAASDALMLVVSRHSADIDHRLLFTTACAISGLETYYQIVEEYGKAMETKALIVVNRVAEDYPGCLRGIADPSDRFGD